jgi:hypothetical protein
MIFQVYIITSFLCSLYKQYLYPATTMFEVGKLNGAQMQAQAESLHG